MEEGLIGTATLFIVVLIIIVLAVVLMYNKYIEKLLTKERNLQKMQLLHKEEMLASVINAEERERKNIAEDLHDNLTASLNILRLQLYQQEALADDTKILTDLDRCIQISRDISHNLKSPILEKFGLLAAIKDLLDAFHTQYDINVYELYESDISLSETQKLHLYRIVQEALVNIIKHANAKTIEVLWHNGDKVLALTIRDDGTGLPDNYNNGIGMSNMQARVDYLQAKSKITSTPSKGTSITLVLTK